MSYTPSKPPAVSDSDAQALASYLNDELQVIASSLRTQDPIQMVVSFVAPSKPRTGLIVYADGTKWNPGSGEGAYSYGADGLWHFMDFTYTPPAPPAKLAVCRLSITANTNVSPIGSFVVVPFSHVDFDTNSFYDSTNHAIFPTIAGYYQFNWGIELQTSGPSQYYIASLIAKGVETARGSFNQAATSSFSTSVGSDIVHMNGTSDEAQISVIAVAGTGTMTLLGGAALTYFSAILLRPD